MRPIYDTDLIKQINKHLIGIDPETNESLISTKDIARIIMETPTANIEPKRGRWIKMTGMMPPEYHGHYECSECQWHMKGIRNSWTREEEMAYCPNCGAKMEGDDTNETD